MARYIRLSDGVKKGFEQDMVKALSVLGYQAMMDAYKQRGFKHRTRNLHDSYASAVYVRGKLIESSVRYIGGVLNRGLSAKRDPETGKTGRETVDDWLHSHSFGQTGDEIVLVVIAAMYYAGILESEWQTGKRAELKKLQEKDDKQKKKKKKRKKRNPTSYPDRIIVISPARDFINQHYHWFVYKVYEKYGMQNLVPTARIIKGEKLK